MHKHKPWIQTRLGVGRCVHMSAQIMSLNNLCLWPHSFLPLSVLREVFLSLTSRGICFFSLFAANFFYIRKDLRQLAKSLRT